MPVEIIEMIWYSYPLLSTILFSSILSTLSDDVQTLDDHDVEMFLKKVSILKVGNYFLKESRDLIKNKKEYRPVEDPRDVDIIIATHPKEVPFEVKRLYPILHAQYLHFWTLISLYACSMIYSENSPTPDRQKSSECLKLGNMLYKTFEREHINDYIAMADRILKQEMGAIFSLSEVNGKLKLLKAYLKMLHQEINRAPTIRHVFENLGKVSENLSQSEKVAIPKIPTDPRREPFDTYYTEIFRRLIKYFGPPLVISELYFNSALVDDKDVKQETLIPNKKESVKFWEKVTSLDEKEQHEASVTLSLKREEAKFELADDVLSEVRNRIKGYPNHIEVRHKLMTQPSGASEYVVLLQENSQKKKEPRTSEL